MGRSEGGDDDDERLDAPERDDEAEEKQQVIRSAQNVNEAKANKARAAWCHRGSRLTSPGSPVNSNARTVPPGGRKRTTVTTRSPRRARRDGSRIVKRQTQLDTRRARP